MSVVGETVGSARARMAMESFRSRVRSALVLGLSILVFFPVLPQMPANSLDASWRMALNEAWAKGFDFARDVVFTYGPYAFLSTQQYQPDTYSAFVVCTLFLGAVLFLLLRHIERGSKGTFRVFPIVLCLIASGYTSSPDVRFLCFVFLFLVATAIPEPEEASGIGRWALFGTPLVLNLAAVCLGLICLVKASYAVEAGAMGALGALALYATGQRLLSASVLMSFAFGLGLFWLAAGQPLSELLRFFLNQAQVAAGYGQAMSSGEMLLPPALFLASTVPLAIAIRQDLKRPTAGRYAVAIGMAITLFLSFKEGFVREDDWHVMIAAEALLILPWCWPSERGHLWRNVQAAMAGSCVLIYGTMFPYSLNLGAQAAQFEQLLHCSDRGPLVCPGRAGWLKKSYETSLARIRLQLPLPKLRGTVDVYTVNQSLAIANGYQWDPRPVPQSYSAYTPALARMNVEHLTDASAPDGVLFALETIDGRLPAFADGPSWPILLTQYRADWLRIPAQPSRAPPIAYLRRKPGPQRITVVATPLLRGMAALGQAVRLPRSDAVLFAKIDIGPNAYGKFEGLLFRQSQLYINFLFPGGRVERYRFVPGMARSGFVISPVITNAAQFVALGDLKVSDVLLARRPIAFWLSGAPSARQMWIRAAAVEISKLREAIN